MEIPVEFKDGQRVTTPEAMNLVRTVLMGEVNQELVEALNHHGNFAVGVSGADGGVIVAEQASPDLGRVGRITRINRPLLDDLVNADSARRLGGIGLYSGYRIGRNRRGRRLLQRQRRHGCGPHRRRHRRS